MKQSILHGRSATGYSVQPLSVGEPFDAVVYDASQPLLSASPRVIDFLPSFTLQTLQAFWELLLTVLVCHQSTTHTTEELCSNLSSSLKDQKQKVTNVQKFGYRA